MTLKMPDLSTTDRQHLAEARDGLAELQRQLESRVRETRKLVDDLREAEAKQASLETKAARDSEAASALTGIETQLARLRPIIVTKTDEIDNFQGLIARRVLSVRDDIIRPLLATPLIEQLLDHVAKLVEPFFFDRENARAFAGQTDSMNILVGYFSRRLPSTEQALVELQSAIADIDKILKGEPLLNLVVAKGSEKKKAA